MSCLTPFKLIESSCVIDENLHSNSINEKSATCLLKLTVEDRQNFTDEYDKGEDATTTKKDYVLHLPPDTLDTLLDGLTRIREQLSNIAKK